MIEGKGQRRLARIERKLRLTLRNEAAARLAQAMAMNEAAAPRLTRLNRMIELADAAAATVGRPRLQLLEDWVDKLRGQLELVTDKADINLSDPANREHPIAQSWRAWNQCNVALTRARNKWEVTGAMAQRHGRPLTAVARATSQP